MTDETLTQICQAIRDRVTERKPGEPIRVFSIASAKTTVLQYAAAGLMAALKRQGCETLVMLTHGEDGAGLKVMDAIVRFDPHVIVTINFVLNEVNRSVYRVSWWQDFMPALNSPLDWRPRDRTYAVDVLVPQLTDSGCINPQRQEMCIDESIFRLKPEIERQDRVVMIGSSYLETMAGSWGMAWETLSAWMARGERVTEDIITKVASVARARREDVLWYVLPKLVRQRTVEWLCQCSDSTYIDVYGRGWETNPIVAPFFRGEVKHGPAVADIYNGAKYALVSHGFSINSQRLSEATACGAIPLVYDCRALSAPPHWDNEMLPYHSLATLRAQIGKVPVSDPRAIASYATYDKFAKRILEDIC